MVRIRRLCCHFNSNVICICMKIVFPFIIQKLNTSKKTQYYFVFIILKINYKSYSSIFVVLYFTKSPTLMLAISKVSKFSHFVLVIMSRWESTSQPDALMYENWISKTMQNTAWGKDANYYWIVAQCNSTHVKQQSLCSYQVTEVYLVVPSSSYDILAGRLKYEDNLFINITSLCSPLSLRLNNPC